MRQHIHASSEEAGVAGPVIGVSGRSGDWRVCKKESKRAMEMRKVREELKRKKKKDLERMRTEREIRV